MFIIDLPHAVMHNLCANKIFGTTKCASYNKNFKQTYHTNESKICSIPVNDFTSVDENYCVCMRNRQLAKECETIGRNHAPILNE